MTTDALDTSLLDRTVAAVRAEASSWSATPLVERIALLERLQPRVVARAAEIAGAGSRAKGYGPDSPWVAEDWIGGPWALVQNTAALLHVLRRIAAGRDPLDGGRVREEDGRTRVDVFPATGWDTLLLNGFKAQVWMRPGVTAEQARAGAASGYRGRRSEPAVALVLGAGNVAAITALDILHKLYVEGQVVIAKMNPVNSYLRPHFEYVFADFVERGWLRFVDGGAAEGGYLTRHDGVDAVHVTGSDRTHDAIMWGTDEDAGRRRHEDLPLIAKPFSSELGGVSPCIVAPGPWSAADFRFQAEHIVTSKMNNSGHNCIASQILVLPREWDGTERLLDEIRKVLRELPSRADYYPGAADRLASVRAAHPSAETHGDGFRLLVPDIADHDDLLVTDEVFGSALGAVRLPGASPEAFLRHAVDFANDTLPGTLGATLIVHPRTEKAHRDAVRSAVADLRYGTLGVNCWSGVGFLLGFTPWGAFPGHTRQDIGSGIGFVHNAFMLEDIEKTVIRAPFAPAPRGLVTGAPSLSPRPPYFVTHRTALTTVERLTRFTAAPSLTKLPALFAAALRG
ncbi:aldehyde dehydrogenase family protein [Streptomyces sp. NBC_00233]|uniref:aldehyde dehydrogenase family protein n=1 Tax=Streptomyces sp. NBC_00233 TaxID=2975686 RepID=UPI00224D1F51|nr:aldehyde dehydrogenase family protein [Streptomyces sp. NBC_00233]MCX5232546.1 aldehyde dehydrogenase family protein [Streptomyces sp. NBC_00233]